jgi:membrane dipeptidase
VDSHNDILSIMLDENYDLGTPSVGKYHTDLARMKEGGLSAEFFSVYVDRSYAAKGGSARRALDLIDIVYRAAEKHPNDLMLSYSVADIRRAKRQGKIAALMGIEGGHAIENSLMALRNFYRLGVRYMTLTHNNTKRLGGRLLRHGEAQWPVGFRQRCGARDESYRHARGHLARLR